MSLVFPPAALLAAAGEAQQGHYAAAALNVASVIPMERVAVSVWSLGNFARGMAVERMLGGNLPSAFPTIDRFAGGVATSIKSIDLGAKTYQDTGKLASTVESYIDKVASFNGASFSGKTIGATEIVGRELQLAVPGAGSAAQQGALKSAADYALKAGVKLTVTQVK